MKRQFRPRVGITPIPVKTKRSLYSPEQRDFLFVAREKKLTGTETARLFYRKFDRDIARTSVYVFWKTHPLDDLETNG